ncbi:MAG: MarC family NAAT transporter [Chitinophagales bacterium]|nr:MarC family NAAT transporter [Chitinophagales bacterium]
MELSLSLFAALFSVVNPFGAMPVFLSMTLHQEKHERNLIAMRTSIYFAMILIVAYAVGQYILSFFGISIEAIRIAGGIIILTSGFALLNGKFAQSRAIDKKVQAEAIDKDDISFTPLAMPLLSGPGSIALLIGLKNEQDLIWHNLITIAVIVLIGLISFLILKFSPNMMRLLGQSGMRSISRIMGFIVMSIGIQYLITAIRSVIFTASGS